LLLTNPRTHPKTPHYTYTTLFRSSRYGNRDIHMKGGITGQRVKAAVKRTKSGKADVKMLELLENSPIETETPCKHFNECGGCTIDRKSTRLNSSHVSISYAVFCLK